MGAIVFVGIALLVLYFAKRRGRNGKMCMETLCCGIAILAAGTAVELAFAGCKAMAIIAGLVALVAFAKAHVPHTESAED